VRRHVVVVMSELVHKDVRQHVRPGLHLGPAEPSGLFRRFVRPPSNSATAGVTFFTTRRQQLSGHYALGSGGRYLTEESAQQPERFACCQRLSR
jgi:hypothetical protein